MPPSEAPIAIGRLPVRCGSVRATAAASSAKSAKRIVPSATHSRVAVAALVERIGGRARTREMLGGAAQA